MSLGGVAPEVQFDDADTITPSGDRNSVTGTPAAFVCVLGSSIDSDTLSLPCSLPGRT
jgi:hypothetical protein